MDTAFNRLVRFVDTEDNVQYGEAGAITDPAKLIGESVEVYEGQEPWLAGFRKTGMSKQIKEVRTPTYYESEVDVVYYST